ncbi:MAG: hypothetical protein ACRDRI_22180 [Pseudonocardiaceae bacterium]
MDVAAIQTDDQRQVRSGQLGPVTRATGDEAGLLVAELVLQPLGDGVGLAADDLRVQGSASGSSSASRVAEAP